VLSGCRYSKAYVLEVLKERQAEHQIDTWQAKEFHCQRLAANVYLLTHTLLQNKERLTRRSTIWQRVGEDWKIIFHQGTIVQGT
jgi:hypothetical protein